MSDETGHDTEPPDTMNNLVVDMSVLGQLGDRFAGAEGERKFLHAVRERLPDGTFSRIEGFVGHVNPVKILGVHGVVILVCGVIGIWLPGVSSLVAIVTCASLIGEATGRVAMLRAPIPKSASYNLVVPDEVKGVQGTLVLAVPLDVPRWRMGKPTWIKRPLMMVFVSAMVVSFLLLLRGMSEPFGVATISLYTGSLVVMGLSVVAGMVAGRRMGDGRGDGAGAAVALELIRRLQEKPPVGISVWTVFTGCGRAHQDGIRAFLSLRGKALPEPVLVVALQDPANSPLQAVVTEGPLWEQHHRPTGPALVERLRWAGLRVPAVDRAEPTDARAAMIMGYRAVGFAGGRGEPTNRQALESADIVETLIRWYDQDLCRLESDRTGLAELAQRTNRPARPRSKGEEEPEEVEGD